MEKNNATSWTFSKSYSSVFTLQVVSVPKSFQKLLQWITVKTVALEHLVLTETATRLQSWIKAQEKSRISSLVKSKQFLVDEKELTWHDLWEN